MDTPTSNVTAARTNVRTSSPLPGYASSSDECIINVTLASEDKDTEIKSCTFELPKPATIITTTCVTDSEGEEEDEERDSEGEPKKGIRRFKGYFTTNFGNSGSQTSETTTTASTFHLIPHNATTTLAASATTTPPASSATPVTATKMIAPRYRFRDLLLGDFSFNDDGER